MVSLSNTLKLAKDTLEKANIKHALIGGFALAEHGIHRATMDIDFLVEGNKKQQVKELLIKAGFNLKFETEEVLQFDGPGYLDILLAHRPLSLKMLDRANQGQKVAVKVLSAEDIIGLKIQAYCNDRSRELKDKADIQELIKSKSSLDFNLIKEYADLFNEWKEIEKLKSSKK